MHVKSDFGNWCEFTVCLPCDSGNRTPMGQSSVPTTMMEQDTSHSSDNSDEEYDSDDSFTSVDSSFESFGITSTTSFQELLHEASRRQAVGMAGGMHNQRVNLLAPTAVASLHKLRTQLLSSSSLKSGSSLGHHSSGTSSSSSMRNVQFQTNGLDSYAGRTASFNQLPLGHSRSRNKLSSKSLKSMGSRGGKNRKRPGTNGRTNGVTGRSSGGTSKAKRRGSASKRRGSGITGGIISLSDDVPHPIPENPIPAVTRKPATPAPTKEEKPEESASSKPKAIKETAKEESKEESKVEEEVNPMARIKVLVAEDNKINQKVLKRTLMRVGINEEILDIVENGKLAVEASEEKAYDIIFMDMQMPVMGGLEATKLIKERDGKDGAKVVFCTAHAVDQFREQADLAGGDGFVSKPFNLKKIKAVLDQYSIATQ